MTRRFQLVRANSDDELVADGEEFCDGTVALYRVGGRPVEPWPDLRTVLARYTNDGLTEFRWAAPFASRDGWLGH